MKFSIIVTVFNTPADYLKECLESVLCQNYQNLEILIIDDGSTDEGTLSILHEYAYEKRIKLIHQKNMGQGEARNTGMDNATGDYYCFLDSDDYYLSPVVFDDLAELLKESHADICSFQYAEFFVDSQRPVFTGGDLAREEIYGKSAEKAAKTLLSQPRKVFSAVTHTKAIKAELISKYNIRALTGVRNEDNYLTAKLLQYAKSYDRYNKVAYAFRRSNLTSLTANNKNFRDVEKSIIVIFNKLFEEDRSIEKNCIVLDFLSSPYVYWMGKTLNALSVCTSSEERQMIKQDISEMRKYSYVLKYSSRLYIRLTGMLTSLFGINFVMNLMRIYLTLNRKHFLSMNRKIK